MSNEEDKVFNGNESKNILGAEFFEFHTPKHLDEHLGEKWIKINYDLSPAMGKFAEERAKDLKEASIIYQDAKQLMEDLKTIPEPQDKLKEIASAMEDISKKTTSSDHVLKGYNIIITEIEKLSDSNFTQDVRNIAEIELKKDQARKVIVARLQSIGPNTTVEEKASILREIMDLAIDAGITGEFSIKITDLANEITKQNPRILAQILSAAQLAIIEKENEEREKFKTQMNKFSAYFEKDELDKEEYKEVAEYIDKPENKKHVEKNTQYHLDNYHELKAKQADVGLSNEEREKKKEHKHLAHTGIKTHITGKIREHGKAHGHSEDTMLETTNEYMKGEEKTNLKKIKAVDQATDDVKEFVENKYSTQQKAIVKEPIKEPTVQISEPKVIQTESKKPEAAVKPNISLETKDKTESSAPKKEEIKDKENIQSSKPELNEKKNNTQVQENEVNEEKEAKPVEKRERQFKLKKPGEPKIKEPDEPSIVTSLPPKDQIKLDKIAKNLTKKGMESKPGSQESSPNVPRVQGPNNGPKPPDH